MNSLLHQAAALVFPRLGSNMPPPVKVDEDLDRFEKSLRKYPYGGLVLFNADAQTLTGTLDALQQLSKEPLLVGSDIERGVGQQVNGGTLFPHAMAFSALPESVRYQYIEEFGYITGKEALACGIHIGFAPVADVNRDPRNPIISIRAFGQTPEAVQPSVCAYIAGCRRAGLLTTLKHFPGHGNTDKDSHAELPTVSSSRAELEAFDLLPYSRVFEKGTTDLVMTAHVRFPSLDPDKEPATGSHPILTELLRAQMGFRGAVITDSLIMSAIQDHYNSTREMAAALLNAGVDILLDPPAPEEMVEAVIAAVKDRLVTTDRLEQAFTRVSRLKRKVAYRRGNRHFATGPPSFAPSLVGCKAHQRFAGQVALDAIQPGSLQEEALFEETCPPVIVFKSHNHRFDPPKQPLAHALETHFPNIEYFEYGPEFDEGAARHLKQHLEGHTRLVIAAIVKPAAWHDHGLSPTQEDFIRSQCAEKDILLASMGSPYWLETFEDAVSTLCTYSDVSASQEALARVLAGQVASI